MDYSARSTLWGTKLVNRGAVDSSLSVVVASVPLHSVQWKSIIHPIFLSFHSLSPYVPTFASDEVRAIPLVLESTNRSIPTGRCLQEIGENDRKKK